VSRAFHSENAASRPQSIRRRWRRGGTVAISLVVLSMAWPATPASAGGALYIVPSQPPSASEAVGFTNALNDRARRLPPSLDPPVAESPAQVEARIKDLERGVVVEKGPRRPAALSVGPREDANVKVSVAPEPGDQAPLSVAFVAAGALAALGLLLGARRRHSGSALGS
jgi:MYXO-CTERM domain-containing protein